MANPEIVERRDAFLERREGVAVIGLPDARVGERACAVIEPSGADVPTIDELREYLTGTCNLAVWKSAERIGTVTEWPVTATGKVQKFVLRGRYT